MAMNDVNGNARPTALERVGTNIAFAGFARIAVTFGGIFTTTILGWAASDLHAMEARIEENSHEIVLINQQAGVLAEKSITIATETSEFRLWTENQMSTISNTVTTNKEASEKMYRDILQLNTRMACVEHKSPCPFNNALGEHE